GEFFSQACSDVMSVLEVQGMGVILRPGIDDAASRKFYGAQRLPQHTLERLYDVLMRRVGLHKATVLINDLPRNEEFAWMAAFADSILAIPLQREEQVLGCIFCVNKTGGEFNSIDAKLLSSIANQCAIYLENSILFRDAQDLMMGMLRSMVSAVDAKDAYTCGHSERVALVARELATVAGMSPAMVDQIYMAGLLHDVGKIGVPEAVLKKPGKLTAEEFEQMKQHPEIGAHILRDVRQLEPVIPGVLHHHERWDGRGYPAKLAGENIPLAGRILCLADCFDAMTSNRTYRPALPFDTALSEIRNGAGTQFDPELAAAFLRISQERLLELTAGHHEQAHKLIEEGRLRVA
ncbi:MAG: HD-GYP domain-containing protein, partial [Tepidisphaeraceae bacterium]